MKASLLLFSANGSHLEFYFNYFDDLLVAINFFRR